MTLKELREKHSDVMLRELQWSELSSLANGAALFYVSLSSKAGPKDNRKILCASHVLTVGMHTDYANNRKSLVFIRTTSHGNVKVDSITEDMVAPNGRAAIFQTTPIGENDPRNTKPWNEWP